MTDRTNSTQKISVSRDFANIAKVLLRSAIPVCLLSVFYSAHAQSTCGFSKLPLSDIPSYPPIARAAHQTGDVVALVAFDRDGKSHVTKIISGSPFLRGAAVQFIESSRAEYSEGSRECPLKVTFEMTGPQDRECADNEPSAIVSMKADDPKQLIISTISGCITVMRDPAGVLIKRKKHFILF